MLSVIAVQLYHLSEVCLFREHFLDSFSIEHEAVSHNLEAVLSVPDCRN